MLILSPPNGFLSRSLFHNPPLSCGERMFFDGFHDFSRQISFLSVLCSIVGMCSFGCCMEGDGEGGKWGTGGENPEGEGGLQPGCPPFPGLSPQDIGKPLLRRNSTQSIRERTEEKGHRKAECSSICTARRASENAQKKKVTEKQNSKACAKHTDHPEHTRKR